MSRTPRTARTTAAAGIAALGVGLAGTALAAPDAPAPAPTPGPALPEPSGLPVRNPLAALPAPPSAPTPPMLFVFEGPTVDPTSVHTAGATPETGHAPVTPGADRIGAPSALDTAGLFAREVSLSPVARQGLGTSSLGLG